MKHLERMTREELRNMAYNSTEIFALPTTNACISGRTMANQLQQVDGDARYSCRIDYRDHFLIVSKSKLPK